MKIYRNQKTTQNKITLGRIYSFIYYFQYHFSLSIPQEETGRCERNEWFCGKWKPTNSSTKEDGKRKKKKWQNKLTERNELCN